MKFYNRKSELKELNNILKQSEISSKMTVITGRRRIGKTILALELCKNIKYLYLFVSKKAENLLCKEYINEIKNTFDYPIIGEIKNFKDIFRLLLEISKKENFTLIIDEFSEFYNINPSIYSDIQNLWDINKNNTKINIIFIGSVYSIMKKIFENSKEPLFARADRIIFLQPFKIKTIYQILKDNSVNDFKNLFDFYLFTGGVPKYVDLLVTNNAFQFSKIIDFMLDLNSPFINEGKNLLIEEFGKEYGTYFSILELISLGKTSRTEIESILEQNIGGYLERLENDYSLISKYKPINSKPLQKQQKYKIIDNFILFWFRFIYRNRSSIETQNTHYIKEIILRDYSTYSGKILEKYFSELISYSFKYNKIGTYWEKGNENEIDIVAINDLKKKIVIAEVKLNKGKINIEKLKFKSTNLLLNYKNYKPEFLELSIEDSARFLTILPNRKT